MPNEPVHDTDLNFSLLEDKTVTYTSADHPAEKSKRPLTLAAYAKGRSATEHTVDRVERKK
jgi:hypothetical protein